MKIIKTEKQIEAAKFPTRLDVLQELNKRQTLNQALTDELYRLERGVLGEQAILQMIEEFGSSHWQVLPNVWLDYYGPFECDLILLTSAGVHPFEIKNYSGRYEYRESQWLMNDERIGHNAISQGQKAANNLQNILQKNSFYEEVYGGIIFAGEHCDVKIYDQIKDFEVLMLNQFRNHLYEIKIQENNHRGSLLDVEQFTRVIEKYEVANPFKSNIISESVKQKCQKGILCSQCGSFDLVINKNLVACSCGTRELTENAIVRTICEYGVINFDKDLTTTELYLFLNKQFSKVTLRKYLKKHFTSKGRFKSTKFINKKSKFNLLLPILDLKQKQLHVLKDYD
jgi:hypothetical protein